MTANQYIAIVLLVGRLITVAITFVVIRKQYRVLRAKKYPQLKRLRRTLFAGSIIIMLGNVIPIIIDALGIVGKGSFNLLLAYVFSNNITAALSAYMTWYAIRISEKTEVILSEDGEGDE